MPKWCNLCKYLTRLEAFIYHELHGEDHCEWSEQGRIEDKIVKERKLLNEEYDD